MEVIREVHVLAHWIDSRASLDAAEKRKISYPAGNQTSVIQPIVIPAFGVVSLTANSIVTGETLIKIFRTMKDVSMYKSPSERIISRFPITKLLPIALKDRYVQFVLRSERLPVACWN